MSNNKSEVKIRRTYISQSDVPVCTLDQAIRVPQAIAENYGYQATKPIQVAMAMDLSPKSSYFRKLTGAAIAYGLTEGGWNAAEIKLTKLGLDIVRPLEEGKDLFAKREAFLRPRVVGEFLLKYDGAQLPKQDIAYNVLEDMGVPRDRTEDVFELIYEGAKYVGFLLDIKGKKYIDLRNISEPILQEEEDEIDSGGITVEKIPPPEKELPGPRVDASRALGQIEERKKRVFIAHGKSKTFIDPIKKLLEFGELTPVVSEERQSVAQPVPEKFMGDMRSCGAAIIHVQEEKRLTDEKGNENIILNPNVLIEIGAAMALYGERFILLVKEGIDLPSNLQGLYEVRYVGKTLDGDTTIKLLEAINDMKTRDLP